MSPRMPPIEFSSGAVVVGEGGEGSEPLMVNRKKGFDDNRARLTANDLIYSPNNLMARLLETHESTTLFRHPEPPSVLSSTTPVAALDRVFSAVSQETDEDLELKSTTAAYVIYPGPEDITIQRADGIIHQQSVTMVAQLFPPPIEAGPALTIWGLPALAWGVLVGCSVLAVLVVLTIFLCCWLLPRSRKLLSPTRFSSARTQCTDRSGPRISVNSTESTDNSEHQRVAGREIIMAHSTTNHNGNMPMNGASGGAHPHHALMYHQSPPQYNPPPVPPKGGSVCSSQTTTTTFMTTQQQHVVAVAQQQQYCHMQAAYQRHQKQQNYCSQILQQQQQQQKYHNYYRINPATAAGAGYQPCSKHSGSSSSNDNSPKVSNNTQNQNGKNQNGEVPNKRHSCIRNSCATNLVASSGAVGGVGTGAGVVAGSLVPDGHKSMWAINNLHSSNSGLSDMELAAYRTRSLPSWGKGNKQRPVSTTDDLEELYAKVNFSKKRRNRMRNDEAAIIALCRSKSQNLSGIPLDRDGIVVYDERTAL